MVIVLAVVASLIAINVYTVETLSLKSPTPIPGYPTVSIAYSAGNIMILIKGALGPYLYSNITINGTYALAGGLDESLFNYTTDSIYLGVTINATNVTFNSTALDLANHAIYFFNATVLVNLSAPTKDVVVDYSGGQLNMVVLGVNPLEAPMEGYNYG